MLKMNAKVRISPKTAEFVDLVTAEGLFTGIGGKRIPLSDVDSGVMSFLNRHVSDGGRIYGLGGGLRLMTPDGKGRAFLQGSRMRSTAKAPAAVYLLPPTNQEAATKLGMKVFRQQNGGVFVAPTMTVDEKEVNIFKTVVTNCQNEHKANGWEEHPWPEAAELPEPAPVTAMETIAAETPVTVKPKKAKKQKAAVVESTPEVAAG